MQTRNFLCNIFFSMCLFVVCFYLSWQISAVSNFLYPIWYEVLNIEETITVYAPKNKNRENFQLTSRQEQLRLFSEIVNSIQNNGEGLAKITYKDPSGKKIDTLLTKAEIVHLQDVAKLLHAVMFISMVCAFIIVILIFIMQRLKIPLASLKKNIIGAILSIILVGSVIFFIGSKKLFYWAHELLFPAQHQWFFYYEDSLMSTMMKAPLLFGPIAIQLLLLTIVIWLGFFYLIQKNMNSLPG